MSGTDNDSYTVDTNTGRLTKFVFTVGSTPKSMTGTLNWSANGTLNQLAITDGFNAGGTQTCNYNPTAASGTGYDDLGRLVGADCGAGQWGQTYAYDPYGNLSKAVISGRTGTAWNPGYSASTNRCSTCTYDSDGNITGDGNNVYGWNVYSKLAWTASSGTPTCGTSGRCITYDAFGRIVETSNGSTPVERWITQLGETAIMSGSTITYGFWPAPAGGTVVVGGNSANFNYMHKDWLSNVRVVSNLASHGITHDQAYSPYGELYDTFGAASAEYEVFADINGNFESGVLWDTPNRELSVVGRWLSPDPAGLNAVNMSNPQTWNRYAYANGNPLDFTDPSGLVPPPLPSGLSCVLDGNSVPCNIAFDMLNSGSAGVCPSSGCENLRVDPATGKWQIFEQWSGPSDPNCHVDICITKEGHWVTVIDAGANNCPSPFLCVPSAANNGTPNPRVSCNSTTGICVPASMIPPPGYSPVKNAVKWYLCGKGSFDNIKNYTLEGFTKGVIVGGIAGWEGGPLGVGLGALGGGVEGFFGGNAIGWVATAGCQAAGMYPPAS